MKLNYGARNWACSSVIAALCWGLSAHVLAQFDDAKVALTDLMVQLPDAELDAFARQYLQQAVPHATPQQADPVPHRASAPSTDQHRNKPGPSKLDFNEVVLSRSEWLSDMNRQADVALANSNWPLAEVTLAQALGEYGDAHKTRLRLAALLYGRGALGQTRAVLQQGIELAPHQPDLRLTLARVLAEQGRFAAALQLLNEHQPRLDTHLDYYSLKADVARRSNQCAQAINTYQQLLEHSRVGGWWLGLGLCQRQQGEDFTAAFLQAQASADLGLASQHFVKQQLDQLQQQEPHGKAQTY